MAQEEIAVHVQEPNNHSLFVLTIFTVWALPVNMIGGLLATNVIGIPRGQNRPGFLDHRRHCRDVHMGSELGAFPRRID